MTLHVAVTAKAKVNGLSSRPPGFLAAGLGKLFGMLAGPGMVGMGFANYMGGKEVMKIMEIYNVLEATRYLKLGSRTTFYKYIEEGIIPEPEIKSPGKDRRRYWTKEQLDSVKPLIRKQGRPRTQEK